MDDRRPDGPNWSIVAPAVHHPSDGVSQRRGGDLSSTPDEATPQEGEIRIDASQLRPGVHVRLPVSWVKHQFMFSSFVIENGNYSGALDRADKLDRGHARAMNFSFSVDVQVCKRTDVDHAMKSFFRRSEHG